jgi:hypothetical protein
VQQFAKQQYDLSADDRRAYIADFWATMTWSSTLLNYIGTLKSLITIRWLSENL